MSTSNGTDGWSQDSTLSYVGTCSSCNVELPLNLDRLRKGILFCGVCGEQLPYGWCSTCNTVLEAEPAEMKQGSCPCPKCGAAITLSPDDHESDQARNRMFPALVEKLPRGDIKIDCSYCAEGKIPGLLEWCVDSLPLWLTLASWAVIGLLGLGVKFQFKRASISSSVTLSNDMLVYRRGGHTLSYPLRRIMSVSRKRAPWIFDYEILRIRFSASEEFRFDSTNLAFPVVVESLAARLKRLPDLARFAQIIEKKG